MVNCVHRICSKCVIDRDSCPLCRAPIPAKVMNCSGLSEEETCEMYAKVLIFYKSQTTDETDVDNYKELTDSISTFSRACKSSNYDSEKAFKRAMVMARVIGARVLSFKSFNKFMDHRFFVNGEFIPYNEDI